MAIEAYVPTEAIFSGRVLQQPSLVVLYDLDSAHPVGSVTVSGGPSAGEEGSLTVIGTRDGRQWRVELQRVVIRRTNPAGFECDIHGPVQREVLVPGAAGGRAREKGFEQHFDIR